MWNRLGMKSRSIGSRSFHLDPDHPTLAISYNNLACFEHETGRTAEACRLWNRAWAILRKHLDDDHPDVCIVRDALTRFCGGPPD
jgi:hypothetical protein